MNARDFAIRAHGSQTYGDGRPYEAHLAEVVANVRRFADLFAPDDLTTLEAAAWLHDTVEDTPTTLGEIRTVFWDAVADTVAAVSNDPRLHGPELHLDTYAKIRSTGRLAKALKLCDRIANVTNSKPGSYHAKRYLNDFPDFRETLYDARDGLEPLWAELRGLIASKS